jgi:hypothetical protein
MQEAQEWAKRSLCAMKSHAVIQELVKNPKVGVYGLGLVAVAIWLLVRSISVLKAPAPTRPTTPDLEKPSARGGKFKAIDRKPGGGLQLPTTPREWN